MCMWAALGTTCGELNGIKKNTNARFKTLPRFFFHLPFFHLSSNRYALGSAGEITYRLEFTGTARWGTGVVKGAGGGGSTGAGEPTGAGGGGGGGGGGGTNNHDRHDNYDDAISNHDSRRRSDDGDGNNSGGTGNNNNDDDNDDTDVGGGSSSSATSPFPSPSPSPSTAAAAGKFLVDASGATLCKPSSTGTSSASLVAVDGAGAVATVFSWDFVVVPKERFRTIAGWNATEQARAAGLRDTYVQSVAGCRATS